MLGALIEAVSRQPYGAYLQQHIFTPLEMQHSYASQMQAQRDGLATGYRYWFGLPVTYDAPYFQAIRPAGYLISSAEDMSHYLAMYLNGGRYHGRVLLSPAGLATMEHPPRGSAYGMGWVAGSYGGVPALSHAGGVYNFQAEVVLVPRGRWGSSSWRTLPGDGGA